MSTELKQNDLEVGMYVTVTGATGTATKEDNSWKGSVLQILAINLPYIAINHYQYPTLPPASLDTRKWKIMKLTDDYVKAMLKKSEVLNG